LSRNEESAKEFETCVQNFRYGTNVLIILVTELS